MKTPSSFDIHIVYSTVCYHNCWNAGISLRIKSSNNNPCLHIKLFLFQRNLPIFLSLFP